MSSALPIASSQGVERESLAYEIGTRREILGARMRERSIDALVVASEANVTYLTGYETTFFGNRSKPLAVVFVPSQQPIVVSHVGEATSIRLDAFDVEVEPYVGPAVIESLDGVQTDYQLPAVDVIGAILDRLEVASVGLEQSWHFIPGFTLLAFDRLRDGFRGDLLDASDTLWYARRRKSAWELEQMRVAARVAEETHQAFAADARTGMSERDLNRLLRHHAYGAGAEKVGYSGIIAGVDRAPLGGPTNRAWERGQMLFVDICLQLNGGYFADFNRVYASVPPTREQREAYGSVVDALTRARDIVRAGTPVQDLAAAMIGDEPTIYARVGHGLGLEMPEPPSLSPLDPTALLSGEVLCIEPNREAPNVGWLVSEEELVVTSDGYELLSPSFPTELKVIG